MRLKLTSTLGTQARTALMALLLGLGSLAAGAAPRAGARPAPRGTSPATFALSTVEGAPGATVNLDLAFTANNAQVASFSTDLLFDSTRLTIVPAGVTAGTVPSGAGLVANTVSAGRLRVLLVPSITNPQPIASGVVTKVAVQIAAGAPAPSDNAVRLVVAGTETAGVRVSDPSGRETTAPATAGGVNVRSGPTQTPVFSLNTLEGAPGATVNLDLAFTANNAQVASFSTDVLFDSTRLTIVPAGVTAGALPAGAGLVANTVSAGRVRVLLVPSITNPQPLVNGVVARVAVQIASNAPSPSDNAVRLTLAGTETAGVRVSDLAGRETSASATAGGVNVRPGAGATGAFKLSTVTVAAGSPADLNLEYESNGAQVASFTTDLLFDSTRLTIVPADITAGTLPAGAAIVANTVSAGRVRVLLVPSLSNPQPIVNGIIAKVKATAAATAPAGSQNPVRLTLAGTENAGVRVSDSAGRESNATGTAGGINIIEDPNGTNPVFQLGTGGAAAGGNVTLPLTYKANGKSVSTAGFDLLLDTAKLTFVSAAGSNLPSGTTLQTNSLEDGKRIRFLFSGSRTALTDNTIASVTLKAAAGLAMGTEIDVPIVLPGGATPGVDAADPNANVVPAEGRAGRVRVGIIGDFNGNGRIDAADVQLIVNAFLGVIPADAKFDLNGNGRLDAADVQREINLFLGMTSSSGFRAGIRGANRAQFRLADVTVRPGAEVTLSLQYTANGQRVSTAGFDLKLDLAKLAFVSAEGLNLPAGTTLQFNKDLDGGARVRCLFSGSRTPLSDGVIARVTLRALPDLPLQTVPVPIVIPGSDTAGVDAADPDANTVDAAGTGAIVTIQPPPPTFAIAGRVRFESGGLAGVSVRIMPGTATPTTAAGGTYRIEELEAGTYTVTPTLSGYTFEPASRSVTGGPDQTDVDFTARRNATVPGAPQRLTARARSRSTIQLSWVDTSSDEEGFIIERQSGRSFVEIARVGANATTYTDSGLKKKTRYRYRVSAFNSAGASSPSNTAAAKTRK